MIYICMQHGVALELTYEDQLNELYHFQSDLLKKQQLNHMCLVVFFDNMSSN